MAINTQATAPYAIPPNHNSGDLVAWQQIGLMHPDTFVQSHVNGSEVTLGKSDNEGPLVDVEAAMTRDEAASVLGNMGLSEVTIGSSQVESPGRMRERGSGSGERSKYKIEQEVTEVCTILEAIRLGRALTLEDEDDPFRGTRLNARVDDRAAAAPRQSSRLVKKQALLSAQSVVAMIEQPGGEVVTDEFITELNGFISAKAAMNRGDGLIERQERAIKERMYDKLLALVEEGKFAHGDQQKACIAMAKMIETNASLTNGVIQDSRLNGISVDGYIATVLETNVNHYQAAHDAGKANDSGRDLVTGSRAGDFLLLQAAGLGAEVSYNTIGKGHFLRGARYKELSVIAEAAGVSHGYFAKEAAKHISRDFGDFEEIGDYLLAKAGSGDERAEIVGALCEGFLTNSVDKTVEANKRRGYNYAGEVFNFSHEYEYNQPLPASRSIQPGLYLLNTMQDIDMDQNDLSAYNQAIVGDVLLHIREAVLRPECMDATPEQLEELVQAMSCLGGEERIAGLSNVISAFDMVVGRTAMTEEQRKVKDLLEMRRTFVPTFENDGSVGQTFIDQMRQATDGMTESTSVESDYCRFICADMAAEYVEAISTMDIPENLMKQQVENVMEIFDETYRADIQHMVLYRAKIEHDRRQMMHELTNGAGGVLAEYEEFAIEEYGTDTPGLTPDTITAEVGRIKDKIGVSINIDIDNLAKILIEPPHRFRSTFENASRGQLDGYNIHRDLGEEAMGVRRLATDLLSDPQPIYGAITSPNGRDEVLGGAGAGFGGAFVELDVDRIADRTLAVPLDSGRYWKTRLMRVPLDYAARFAAINNVANKRYPEAIIMGGVNVSDIKKINIDVSDNKHARALVNAVHEFYPYIEVEFVDRHMATTRKQSIIIADRTGGDSR